MEDKRKKWRITLQFAVRGKKVMAHASLIIWDEEVREVITPRYDQWLEAVRRDCVEMLSRMDPKNALRHLLSEDFVRLTSEVTVAPTAVDALKTTLYDLTVYVTRCLLCGHFLFAAFLLIYLPFALWFHVFHITVPLGATGLTVFGFWVYNVSRLAGGVADALVWHGHWLKRRRRDGSKQTGAARPKNEAGFLK